MAGFLGAILAGQSAAESAAGRELRALYGMVGWGWVRDTSLLAGKLSFARSWGYNTLVLGMDAPSLRDFRGDSNWVRDAASREWRLARGGRPGISDARGSLQRRVRDWKAVAGREGFRLVPLYGPMGWGGVTAEIDPSSAAGTHHDLRIPAPATNRFRLRSRDKSGAVVSLSQQGEARGEVRFDTGAGGTLGGSIRAAAAGRVANQAHFVLAPGQESYWTLSVSAQGRAVGDSATLAVYRFAGWENHPMSTRRLDWSGLRLPKRGGRLETRFFARPRDTFFVELAYHPSAPGGRVDFRDFQLKPSVPPRSLFLGDSLSLGETALGDSAWNRLTRIRGDFLDPLESHRRPVDASSPAARQIYREVALALAEALGERPRYHHLGGDEVFAGLETGRMQRGPHRNLDKGGRLAELLLDRFRVTDSIYAGLYPRDTVPTAYFVYADMFTSLNGFAEGTMGGLAHLARSAPPGRLVLVPWYYDGSIRDSDFLYRRIGISSALPGPERFTALLRRDARAITEVGLDFAGLYSTAMPGPSLEEEEAGAKAWAAVCREFQHGPSGRCLGMGYAGWDVQPEASWGNAYNGLVFLARHAWTGSVVGSQPIVDSDGDGILDVVRTGSRGPYPGRNPPAQ